jgi:hypothetical protein
VLLAISYDHKKCFEAYLWEEYKTVLHILRVDRRTNTHPYIDEFIRIHGMDTNRLV